MTSISGRADRWSHPVTPGAGGGVPQLRTPIAAACPHSPEGNGSQTSATEGEGEVYAAAAVEGVHVLRLAQLPVTRSDADRARPSLQIRTRLGA